jgi:hypothetical protein
MRLSLAPKGLRHDVGAQPYHPRAPANGPHAERPAIRSGSRAFPDLRVLVLAVDEKHVSYLDETTAVITEMEWRPLEDCGTEVFHRSARDVTLNRARLEVKEAGVEWPPFPDLPTTIGADPCRTYLQAP